MRRIAHFPYRLALGSRWSFIAYRYRFLFGYRDSIIDIVVGFLKDHFLGSNAEAQPDVRVEPLYGAKEGGAVKSKRWCLFAAYSPKSVVTEMVFTQLRSYAESGFSVVFISMSASISQPDRQRLSEVCTHIIHRRSFGRDFGAWAHAVRLLPDEIGAAETLLLTNDSNLGPFVPLQSWIDRCMERKGVFGLTESLDGGSHLQSYFLVGHGSDAVGAMLRFLRTLRLSHRKRLMIRRGEIQFTRFMTLAGHYTGAAVDYQTLEDVYLDNPELWFELEVVLPNIFNGIKELKSRHDSAYNRYLLRSRLFLFALNPSHHFSLVLMRYFHFPFVKAELVVKNPAMLPSAPDWRQFINDESPVTEEMVEDHLATLIQY